MSMPIFFPTVKITPFLSIDKGAVTLRQLCNQASIACAATGLTSDRQIIIQKGKDFEIIKMPGQESPV